MREGTLWFIYAMKYFELFFLIAWTILMIVQGSIVLAMVKKAHGSPLALACLVLVPICMFLAVLNTCYNNLAINIRFKCKIACKTCGLCCFDGFNFLIGYCCMKRFCRDKCCEWPTLLKWGLKLGIFGYTMYAVFM